MTPTRRAPVVSSGTEEALRTSHPVRVALLFAAASAGVLAVVSTCWCSSSGLPDWVFYGRGRAAR